MLIILLLQMDVTTNYWYATIQCNENRDRTFKHFFLMTFSIFICSVFYIMAYKHYGIFQRPAIIPFDLRVVSNQEMEELMDSGEIDDPKYIKANELQVRQEILDEDTTDYGEDDEDHEEDEKDKDGEWKDPDYGTRPYLWKVASKKVHLPFAENQKKQIKEDQKNEKDKKDRKSKKDKMKGNKKGKKLEEETREEEEKKEVAKRSTPKKKCSEGE